MFLGGHGFNILIHKYFSEEWELLLFTHYKFMSDYLYFSSNLTDIKNHMLNYIVGCKSVLQ